MNNEFSKALEELLNKHSIDNFVGMPDFILKDAVVVFINNLKVSLERAKNWHGWKGI